MSRTSIFTLPLVAVLALLLPLGGCGWFDSEDPLGITIPITYTVPLDIPITYPNLERLQALQQEGERSLDVISYFPVSLGDLDERLGRANVIREVLIREVKMEVIENTLEDVELQPFELRVGEPGVQIVSAEISGADWDSALPVAIIPALQPATPPFTGELVGEIIEQNRDEVAGQMAKLEFGIGLGTAFVIPEGDLPAGGSAKVRFTLTIAVRINPFSS